MGLGARSKMSGLYGFIRLGRLAFKIKRRVINIDTEADFKIAANYLLKKK